MNHFKVFIEFVTILLLFYVLVFWPQDMCDLGSLTRDQTCTLYIEKQSLNHWAEEPEIKLPTHAGSRKKQESSRETSISALLTMPKPLTVWITIHCGKF